MLKFNIFRHNCDAQVSPETESQLTCGSLCFSDKFGGSGGGGHEGNDANDPLSSVRYDDGVVAIAFFVDFMGKC